MPKLNLRMFYIFILFPLYMYFQQFIILTMYIKAIPFHYILYRLQILFQHCPKIAKS